MHECLKLVCLFSPVPVGLYAIEWSTGRMVLNYWTKMPWIAFNFLRSSGAGTLIFIILRSLWLLWLCSMYPVTSQFVCSNAVIRHRRIHCCMLQICNSATAIWLLRLCSVRPDTAKTMFIHPGYNITLCYNKIKSGDILIPANPGPPGKWPIKWRKRESVTR